MQSAPNSTINEYDFSALEEIQPKEFNLMESLREILFYSLPLFSFGLFMLILFGAVIPNIEDMSKKYEEIETLKTQDELLKQRISNIQELGKRYDSIEEAINKINDIIPTGRTEVVKFGERIKETVTAQNLKSNSQKIGETVFVDEESTGNPQGTLNTQKKETTLPLSEIPTKFDLTGSFDAIRNFFNALYNGQDFFVVDKMELNGTGGGDWYGTISLVKYQFSPSTEFDPVKAYAPISENTQINQKVVKFLEDRYQLTINSN